MASFPISVALRLKDLFSGSLNRIFNRAERRAAKAGDRMGAKLRKGIGKRVAGVGRKVGAGAASVLGVGLAGGLAQAGARVRDFERKLEDVRVQMGRTRPEADELRQAIKDISSETNVSRATILDGAEAIANLQGNTTELNEKLDVLARATVASRAPVADLASTWDALDKAFFRGAGSAEDMEGALSAAIEAGKQGSIPLSEMGVLLGRVATQFDDVAVSGKAGIADMVAALQVVKGRGFGEAAEAATGMNAAIKQLIARAPQLKKLGVKVFEKKDGKRQLRDLRTILDQFEKRGLKDPLKLQQALKDSKAIKFIGALLDKDVRAKWDEIANSAAKSQSVQTDFADKMTSAGAKIEESLNRISNAMDDAFTPERVRILSDALSGFITLAGAATSEIVSLGETLGKTAGFIATELGLVGGKGPATFLREFDEETARIEQAEAKPRAAELGILRGATLSESAVAEAKAERAEQQKRSTSFRRAAGAGAGVSEQTKLVEQLLAAPGIKVGRVAPRGRLSGEAGQLESELITQVEAERTRLLQERTAALQAAIAQAVAPLVAASRQLDTASTNMASKTSVSRIDADRAHLAQLTANAPPTGAR